MSKAKLSIRCCITFNRYLIKSHINSTYFIQTCKLSLRYTNRLLSSCHAHIDNCHLLISVVSLCAYSHTLTHFYSPTSTHIFAYMLAILFLKKYRYSLACTYTPLLARFIHTISLSYASLLYTLVTQPTTYSPVVAAGPMEDIHCFSLIGRTFSNPE